MAVVGLSGLERQVLYDVLSFVASEVWNKGLKGLGCLWLHGCRFHVELTVRRDQHQHDACAIGSLSL